MLKRTPLYDAHVSDNAKLVDFAGWEMPIHYGSQIAEHHAVRKDAGMFDVSHMTVVDMQGNNVRDYLRHLLANDVARLKTSGKALYTCMLNENGGILDDLIVYYIDDEHYRLVVNAATGDKDLAWMKRQAEASDVSIHRRTDLAMIAVQGPNARDRVHQILSGEDQSRVANLAPFHSVLTSSNLFIARTGYTGEDGYEMIVPADQASDIWKSLRRAGVAPAGLGARDTLRLEAGMNLYGTDMDESTTPLVSGLGWTVAWEPEDRDFIGRAALSAQRNDDNRPRFVGLVLPSKGVLRNHQQVIVDGRVAGEITSGSFSPVLGKGIALARVPRDVGSTCQVDVRGKPVACYVVKPPFVRHGKVCVPLGEE